MISQKYKKKLPRKIDNITGVLVSTYIKILMISTIVGLILFFVITGKELVHRKKEDDNRIINSVSYFINMQLEDIRRYCNNMLVEDEMQDIFQRKKEIRNNLLGTYLIKKLAQRDEILSIHVIWGNQIVSEYKYPMYNDSKDNILDKLNLERKNIRRNNGFWGIGKDTTEEGENVFYLVGAIRSKTDMSYLGKVIIFVDTVEIEKYVIPYVSSNEFQLIIESVDKNTLYFPKDSIKKISDYETKYEEQNKWPWFLRLFTDNFSKKELEGAGVNIYGISKKSAIYPNIEFSLIFMLIITIEFIIMASLVIKKKIIGPLENIGIRAREIADLGVLDIQFSKEQHYQEVDDISSALNEMMKQIKRLMEEGEKREKLQRQLELSVINHQIKPHFLYNTLNAVSILISVEDKAGANELIKVLASYYRSCLNQGNDIITLKNELKIVEDYIKIALIRNPNISRVKYEVDESLLDIHIPKMTIQTLVENSMKYGIKQINEPIHILIKVEKKGQIVLITVEDNGTGMKKDIQMKIMEGRQLDVISGFGLNSLIKRLMLQHDITNINDIFTIETRENEYTRIILKIPYTES